jgi:hypothetical protein
MQYVDAPLLAKLPDQDRAPLMALNFTALRGPASSPN